MTRVQQVLFQVEADYAGHPYYVSGNALYRALASRVDSATRRALCVSHGVFFPGEYGEAPSWHSWSGSLGKAGSSLPPVERYDDLFLFRDTAQRWLKASRPRDAHNAHPLVEYGGRVAFAPTMWFGRPPGMRTSKRSVRWYVQCYLHAESSVSAGSEGIIPVSDEVLDGVQVGGNRNYGFGELSVVDSQVIELDELRYDRIEKADEHVIELVSPFVLESEFHGADAQSVPWWWDVIASSSRVEAGAGSASSRGDGLRRRAEQLVVDGEVYGLETVDHGQVVGYAGSDPVVTARNGVLRAGTHSQFGFGEFRVRPATDDRVPDRVKATCASAERARVDARGGE